MYTEFDRGLFATVLVAMAVLLSLTGVARFPTALQSGGPADLGHEAAPASTADRWVTSLH